MPRNDDGDDDRPEILDDLEYMFDHFAIESGAIIEEDDYVFGRFKDDEGEWHDFTWDWEDWDEVIDFLDEWDFDYDIYFD
jgi:hypothetical protein